ncbi:MAG TPA: hypothetical protein VD907_05055 [Verrucomicrobiae bacterium]|nr:hypothetical protein [Verrucomicrobiae bacterium]
METSEQHDTTPKRHILQFIGVAIILAAVLLAGLYFLNRRSDSSVTAGEPIVTQPEPAPETTETAETRRPADSQTEQASPSQIPSAGPSDVLWLMVPVLGGLMYLTNEYRKSRVAVTRAAMHKTSHGL